jgi:PKD repeat protein
MTITAALSPPRLLRPRSFVIAALAAAALLPAPSAHACDSPTCQKESTDMAALLAPADATHRAIASGDWSSPATWQGGTLPAAGALVLIPADIDVRYDLPTSPRIDTIRVEGALRFATDRSTRLFVDTLFVPVRTGVLEIGTPLAPIPAQFTCRITITADRQDANGNTLLAPSDTKQFGRGVIAKGKTTMHGAAKDSWLELAGDALAGDSFLTLKRPPSGWQVGDTLALAGTNFLSSAEPAYDGTGYYARALANNVFQDEELTITAIDGTRVYFTNNHLTGDASARARLRFNHRRPTGTLARPSGVTADFAIHVGNLTRNITIESETGRDLSIQQAKIPDATVANPEPDTPALQAARAAAIAARRNEVRKRGHTMFMHTTEVDIVHVAFWHLGRTDKHFDLDEVGTNLDGRTGTGANQRGRYAAHFHRTGVLDWQGTPASMRGCAVWGSPGWGIAHHEANLVLEENVIYEVLGTAVMQEAGNEIGTWRRNLSIKTYGGATQIAPNQSNRPGGNGSYYGVNTPRLTNFDYGWEGVGFWLHGAGQIAGEDNIATSNSSAGFAMFGNADGGVMHVFPGSATIAPRLLPSSQRDMGAEFASLPDPTIENSHVPLRQLRRMVAYNSAHFFHVWGHKLGGGGENLSFITTGQTVRTNRPSHPYISVVEDFLGWGLTSYGIKFDYSTQYLFRDGFIHAATGYGGQIMKINGINLDLRDVVFDNFAGFTHVPIDISVARGRDFRGSEWRDVTFRQRAAASFGVYAGPHDFGAYFRLINVQWIAPPSPNTPPTATFTATPVGALAFRFDASASASVTPTTQASKNILSYAWDFNGDGQPDKFGRVVHHHFASPGDHPVALTVWDERATTATTTQTITAQPTPYLNAFGNGDFAVQNSVRADSYNSVHLRSPSWGLWGDRFNSAGARIGGIFPAPDGFLRLFGLTGAVQIVPDNRMRRGDHAFSLRMRVSGTYDSRNRIRIRLYGINGAFNSSALPGSRSRPAKIGGHPIEVTRLIDEEYDAPARDWTNYSWPVSLGNEGFDWLVVELGNDPRGVENEVATVDFDDVSLTGPGTPVTLAPARNLLPEVTLDTPGRTGPGFTVVATPRDDDGTIAKVEFFHNSVLLGQRTQPPYTWRVTDAAPGVHEFYARVTDDRGGTALAPERYTQVVLGAPDTPPPPLLPPAPSALTPTTVSGSRIDLAWTNHATDAIELRLERRPANAPAGDAAYAQIALLPPDTTTYTDTGLTSGITYLYRIRAINTVGNSPYALASGTTWSTVVAPTALYSSLGQTGAAQTVRLFTPTPGASIRYTLDGSAPTATTGLLYTGPVTLAPGQTLRSQAFLDGFEASRPATFTPLSPLPTWQGLLLDQNIAPRATFADSSGLLETQLQSAGFTHLLYDRDKTIPTTRPSWWARNALYENLSGLHLTYSWVGPRWFGADRIPLVGSLAANGGTSRVTLTPQVTAPTYRRLALILTRTTQELNRPLQGSVSATLRTIRIGDRLTTLDRTITINGTGAQTAVGLVRLPVRPGQPIEITLDYPGGGSGVSLAFDDPSPATNLAAWRFEHFGSDPTASTTPAALAALGTPEATADLLADPDADGLPHLLEYALGTDPLVPDSSPLSLSLNPSFPHSLSLSFLRLRADLAYTVEASSDRVNWTVIATDPGTLGQSVTVTDPATGPRRALRLRVTTTDGLTALAAERYPFALADTDDTAPPTLAAPSGLTATARSGSRIDLAWTNQAADATELRLERRRAIAPTGDDPDLVYLYLPPGATTYTDTGLAGDTAYLYRLRASGPSGHSPVVNVTASTWPTVAAPTVAYLPADKPADRLVQLQTTTSGATLRYTLDDTLPTPFNGTAYTGPVTVIGGATLRAQAYRDGHEPSPVTTFVHRNTTSSFWTFNERAVGLTASTAARAILDLHPSGHNRHLTATAAFPVIAGAPAYGTGRALEFNGKAGLALNPADLATEFSYAATDSFTLEVVARIPSDSSLRPLVAKDLSSQALAPLWRLWVEGGKVRFQVSDRRAQATAVSSLNVNDGVWRHLAAVRDATDPANKRLRLFIDGQPAGDIADPTTLSVRNATSLRIGRFAEMWNPEFKADLDFVRITSAALTPAQFTASDAQIAAISELASWREQHFGTAPSAALGAHHSDPDADGLPNLLEYALARDPLVPDSTPPLLTSTSTSPFNLSVSFYRRRADLIYTVEASSTLAPDSWQVIATDPGQVSETVPVVVTDPTTPPRRFLRLRVTPR